MARPVGAPGGKAFAPRLRHIGLAEDVEQGLEFAQVAGLGRIDGLLRQVVARHVERIDAVHARPPHRGRHRLVAQARGIGLQPAQELGLDPGTAVVVVKPAVVVAVATQFLALAALFQVVDVAQAVAAGMLRGLHDTRVPMLMAAVGYWGFGIPLSAWFAFGLDWGGAGVWLGLLTGLSAAAVLLTWRWWKLTHRQVGH